MKCPSCAVNLVMSERQGVEIDYCPECRGVWLDRGELDKIIERSQSPYQSEQKYDNKRDFDNDRDNRGQGHYGDHHKHGKKKSFLDDLFDF